MGDGTVLPDGFGDTTGPIAKQVVEYLEELGRLRDENARVMEAWESTRDEILNGDGTLDNDQTNWVLAIIDDHVSAGADREGEENG